MPIASRFLWLYTCRNCDAKLMPAKTSAFAFPACLVWISNILLIFAINCRIVPLIVIGTIVSLSLLIVWFVNRPFYVISRLKQRAVTD